MFYAGCAAFALFLLGDLNDLKLRRNYLALCFPIALLLLILSAAAQAWENPSPIGNFWLNLAAWLLFLVFVSLEIYSLFFALQPKTSYLEFGRIRPVNGKGVYSLCRHPGVIWFFFAGVFLWLASGFPLYAVLAYTMLDILLVLFEDFLVFPKLLDGYGEYKKLTPFLIPSTASIKKCAAYYLRSLCEDADR